MTTSSTWNKQVCYGMIIVLDLPMVYTITQEICGKMRADGSCLTDSHEYCQCIVVGMHLYSDGLIVHNKSCVVVVRQLAVAYHQTYNKYFHFTISNTVKALYLALRYGPLTNS